MEKNLFDTTETHRKKTWLLSWPSSDSCFVLFFCNVFTEWPRWSDCFFPLVQCTKTLAQTELKTIQLVV